MRKSNSDGLSRQSRHETLSAGMSLSVTDSNLASLLTQAKTIAGFLKYYNIQGGHEGYFDDFLTDFNDPGRFITRPADGHMEASKALLYIFLQNLNRVSGTFNDRWKNYIYWYIEDVLKVKLLPVVAQRVWLSFTQKPLSDVVVSAGTRFITHNKNKQQLYYTVDEDTRLLDTAVEKASVLILERDNRRVPEKYFQSVTSLRFTDIATNGGGVQNKSLKTLGIKITSPALLLKEGNRKVTITFFSEKNWEEIIQPAKNAMANTKRAKDIFSDIEIGEDESLDDERLFAQVLEKFTENMFYLTISTTAGWEKIEDYCVKKLDENKLELKFTLPEEFSATTGCTPEKHKFLSRYPKLNIHLNFDAWMYPYSWIKDFIIHKAVIKAEVKGVSNVDVYNELGQVDVSKPFAPFGINNNKGAWLALGSYEMAVKHTKSIDIDIKWRQLPEHNKGLYQYYSAYGKEINNTSFIVQSRFLADYDWKEPPGHSMYYLFSSEGTAPDEKPLPDAPLLPHSVFRKIDISKMPVVDCEPEEYKYTQKTRSGFVDLVLQSPDIGFGEQEYRKLFTEQLMKNAAKSKKYPAINPPVNPLIERITINYIAEDIIDLTGAESTGADSYIDAILPLDTLNVFPAMQKKALPFAIALEDKNILLALRNVIPGSLLNVYFRFIPLIEEVAEKNIPHIQWYIGNIRHWKAMPSSFVQKDETRRLSVNGRIQFLMPEIIEESLFDSEGLLWIRGGYSTEDNVALPKISEIYTNAVPLTLSGIADDTPFKDTAEPLQPEKNIPGVVSFRQISAFYAGRELEKREDRLVRISEFITHRGRAVTARDYERMVLQAFPEVAKAKCYKTPGKEGSTVFVAVLPETAISIDKPMMSNNAMMNIERYLKKNSSAYVDDIKVTNPLYQEILVRAVLKFNGEYLSEAKRKLISAKMNRIIAPWREEGFIPKFNYGFNLNKFREAIATEFKADISIIDLRVFRFRKRKNKYLVDEYNDFKPDVVPDIDNIVFIPAKEHFIYIDGTDTGMNHDFGISEMKLGDTFII